MSYRSDKSTASQRTHSSFTILAMKLGLQEVIPLGASGDDGASSSTANQNFAACGYDVLFPVGDPYFTGVEATAGAEKIITENVCRSDKGHAITSGGGFSTHYPRPSFQDNAVTVYLNSLTGAGNVPVPGLNLSE